MGRGIGLCSSLLCLCFGLSKERKRVVLRLSNTNRVMCTYATVRGYPLISCVNLVYEVKLKTIRKRPRHRLLKTN